MKASDINKIFKDLADMGKAKLVTYKQSLAIREALTFLELLELLQESSHLP